MKNTLNILTIALLGLGCAPKQIFAATPSEILVFQSKLSEMNRLKPLQNPHNKLSHDILDSTLIDRENKVIGQVDDIIVKENGDIETISADLDRLHLGGESLFLDFHDLGIKSASNGYKMEMNGEEITMAYAELLASIETAAGEGGMLSVKSLLGSDVFGMSGTRLGKVSEILFDKSASLVDGIYLSVDYKTIRNRGIAIPLSALTFVQELGRTKVMIDQDYADAVVKYVKDD